MQTFEVADVLYCPAPHFPAARHCEAAVRLAADVAGVALGQEIQL